MATAKTSIYLDIRSKKKDETYPVKIRITYDRKQKYYLTGVDLTKASFDRIMYTGKRLSEDEKDIRKSILDFETKAFVIIKDLPVFTWLAFEKKYQSNRAAKDTISDAITAYAKELRKQGRIGTAYSYECTKSSLDKFLPGAKFVDITPGTLSEYEQYMTEKGRSITTVGIYLRSLRSIFNNAILNGDLNKTYYPFGNVKEGRYEIPTGKNIKKALTIQEIKNIYNYKAEPGSVDERCHAYWMFMYLANGLNCSDMCRLKYDDIKDDTIEFIREKTKRTKKEVKAIEISYTKDLQSIIKRFGNKNKTGFIFPVVEKGLTPERERQLILQIIGVINDHMKRIANKLKITSNVSTMSCRHSFSTILQQAGVPVSFISEALGHSSLATTQNYLKGFTSEVKKDHAKLLTAFQPKHVRKANIHNNA